MSKKANSKTEQGYEPKPVFAMCSNCKHFRSEKIMNEWNYEEEKNIRCGIGDFAVKKQGTCKMHENELDLFGVGGSLPSIGNGVTLINGKHTIHAIITKIEERQ